MLTYSRWSPHDLVAEVESHVRAHLSSVATPDDDPVALASDVWIRREGQGGGVLIVGELNAEPVALYLMPGFHPDDDLAVNPLSVPSIEDRP